MVTAKERVALLQAYAKSGVTQRAFAERAELNDTTRSSIGSSDASGDGGTGAAISGTQWRPPMRGRSCKGWRGPASQACFCPRFIAVKEA